MKALAIAAQWFQPEKTVDYGAVRAWLDAAAERAVGHLAEKKVFGPGRLAERRWATRIEACQGRALFSAVVCFLYSEHKFVHRLRDSPLEEGHAT